LASDYGRNEKNIRILIMVEVFKTNIEDLPTAEQISGQLYRKFPNYRVTFDLEDCDHILRVESNTSPVEVDGVIKTVQYCAVEIAVLEA
jgi:hypothetical protein